MRSKQFLLPMILLVWTRIGVAVDLKPETIEGFDHYVTEQEVRMEPRFRGVQFLWSDEVPGLRDQLLQGVVVVAPTSGSGVFPVKNGLIQDWQGAIFIPHRTLKEILATVQDYDRHQEIYKPQVAESKMRSRQGEEFQVFLRIVKTKFFLSAVLNTEHKIHFVPVDSRRVYSRAYSTRIAEVNGEHELPVGKDRGLLWRMYGYWFFEERDGGVYIAARSITLTRDIPLGMGKLLGPIIHDVPGESLRSTLEQTRKAVLAIEVR